MWSPQTAACLVRVLIAAHDHALQVGHGHEPSPPQQETVAQASSPPEWTAGGGGAAASAMAKRHRSVLRAVLDGIDALEGIVVMLKPAHLETFLAPSGRNENASALVRALLLHSQWVCFVCAVWVCLFVNSEGFCVGKRYG